MQIDLELKICKSTCIFVMECPAEIKVGTDSKEKTAAYHVQLKELPKEL